MGLALRVIAPTNHSQGSSGHLTTGGTVNIGSASYVKNSESPQGNGTVITNAHVVGAAKRVQLEAIDTETGKKIFSTTTEVIGNDGSKKADAVALAISGEAKEEIAKRQEAAKVLSPKEYTQQLQKNTITFGTNFGGNKLNKGGKGKINPNIHVGDKERQAVTLTERDGKTGEKGNSGGSTYIQAENGEKTFAGMVTEKVLGGEASGEVLITDMTNPFANSTIHKLIKADEKAQNNIVPFKKSKVYA